MNLISTAFQWLAGNDGAQRAGDQQIGPAATAHADSPAINIDKAMQVSTVWGAVMLLVENLASLPLSLYEPAGEGARQKVSLGMRLAMILHQRPNRRQSPQEFWEQMFLSFFMRGNAYARIQRDPRGEIVALWPMNADQVLPVLLPDGTVVYKYSLNYETLIFPEAEVFHMRGPGNGIVGLSPLDHMRSQVGLAISAQDHTTKVYHTDGRRPGILMSDAVLNKDQRAAVKREFGEIVRGGERELYVLEANFKFEPLGMSAADIQLLETRKFSVQDLARWWGVPSVLINDTGETTALGSSVEQIIEAFFKLKLRPQLTRFEQAIDAQLLNPNQRAKGWGAKFNFDALLRATLKDRMELYAKAVQNGLKTRNEARALENDPPVEGGDMVTVQSNLAPLGMLPAMAEKSTIQPGSTNQTADESVRQ